MEPLGSLKSVHDRHNDIEHEDIRIQGNNAADSIFSIVCNPGDLKLSTELLTKFRQHALIIVGEENLDGGHNRCSASRTLRDA